MGRAPCCDKANVKKGPWSPEEDAKLKTYIEQNGTGGNWIALPQKIGLKRCGKSCRLRWLNYLRPNIKHGGFSEEEDNIICNLYISIGSRWSIIAAQLPGRTDNDIKNYWNTRLKKKLLGKQRKEQQQARRVNGGSLKQAEMSRKGNIENSMLLPNQADNQNPYWPELPVLAPILYSTQEPRRNNDHASIRKLLIKLGGRFSSDDQQIDEGSTNLQFPVDISSSGQQVYEQSVDDHMMSSAHPTDTLNIPIYQFTNTQYNMDMLQQGENSLHQGEFEPMVYSNTQRLDGLEFLYGDEMVNNRAGTNTSFGESIGWGETSSVVYPPVSSNYEDLHQEMLQECGFEDELGYAGRVQ